MLPLIRMIAVAAVAVAFEIVPAPTVAGGTVAFGVSPAPRVAGVTIAFVKSANANGLDLHARP